MQVFHSSPSPIPQRVIVAGSPGDALTAFLDRLAGTLDVPLVPSGELATPADAARLADFDGWVSTGDHPGARAHLLERAQLVVHLAEATGSLRSLVRRTVRKIRADAPAPDLTWLDALPLTHPELAVLKLTGQAEVDAWLGSLGA